ncbi:MaoC/PaaZ C-terminal domain-containing protein [Nocardia inohanensis]|uniref:MaoC/PaaZ C-terminal domain-containing protein n=1 Tax=Nocardia inohanensis TaxID=209246 RepID=UPI00082DD69F|nr:MaoC/PaaZ C-terminal domain-containing protein [Nocardia inohanensis]
MSDEQLRFDSTGVGEWTTPGTYSATGDRIAAYAEATNDPIDAHRVGYTASPVFAVVPVFQNLLEPVVRVVPASLLGRIVHGSHDFRFHRPIRRDETLTVRSRVSGYRGTPKGTPCTVVLETRDATGALVNEQIGTLFVRGADAEETVGEVASGHSFDPALREQAPVAKVVQHIDDDQTVRYAEASGDRNPIHLDAEFARKTGLPGVITHGMCTMAIVSSAVLREVAGGDAARLHRFAVRFAGPALPGKDIETTIWRLSTTDGVTAYAFETTQDGVAVLSHGLATVSD